MIGTAAAGKLLTGLSGTWAGFGARSPTASSGIAATPPARSARRARRDLPELQARRPGRRPDARAAVHATDTTGTATAYSSLLGPIAPRRPLLVATAQPMVGGPAGARQDRPGHDRHVEPGAGRADVPVGAVQRERAHLRGDPERHRDVVRGHGRRRRPRDPGGRPGDERDDDPERVQHRDARGRRRPRSRGRPASRAPADHRLRRRRPAAAARASGIWRGVGPIDFAFRWYRCDDERRACALAQTATPTSSRWSPKDAGGTIGLTVRATDAVRRRRRLREPDRPDRRRRRPP